MLSYKARVAITKTPQTAGAINNRHLSLTAMEAESKVSLPAASVPGEDPLPGPQMASSHCVLREEGVRVLSGVSFVKSLISS